MGRSLCSEKDGIKKGPWTPEEDIRLVSYIQKHGPGNWRSVPTNTGLMRCSKSCRLRWTNYLRPGIKRGKFTPREEGLIIHLQSMLGNKWAAIASHLPQRTDNDVKNYWNTHLKKKVSRNRAENTCRELASRYCTSIDRARNSDVSALPMAMAMVNPSSYPLPDEGYECQSIRYLSANREFTTFGPWKEPRNYIALQEPSSSSLPLCNYGKLSSETQRGHLHLAVLENWLLDEAVGQVDGEECTDSCYISWLDHSANTCH